MDDTAALAAWIDRKEVLLTHLRPLVLRQRQLAAAGDAGRLLKLLAAKQTLLAELERVEQGLHPFRAQDPEARRWPSPERRQRCQAAAERCAALLADILREEEAASRDLEEQRSAAAALLAELHGRHEARSAYADADEHSPAGALDLSST